MNRNSRSQTTRERCPTIEALRALVILEETGGVSETARRLGVSQPVISKKLQVFKDSRACGAILLRSEGRVELTEEAHAVLPAIRELLSRYDRIVRYLHQEAVSPQVLRIGSGSFAAEHYLPLAIAQLRPTLEDCQIETQVCRGRDRIVGTARGVFDLSIVTHDKNQIRQILRDERLDESLLKVDRLGRHPLCVLTHIDSDAGRELQAASGDKTISLSQLASWELVGPDRQSGLRRQLEQRAHGKSLYFIAEGGGWAAAKQFAQQGIGVAIVPWATVSETDRAWSVSRRLSAEFDVVDNVLFRPRDCNPFVERTIKAIKEAVRTRGGRAEHDATTAIN